VWQIGIEVIHCSKSEHWQGLHRLLLLQSTPCYFSQHNSNLY